MVQVLDIIGLALIVVGWWMQIRHLKHGSKELCPKFLKLYIIGVLLLVIGGFAGGMIILPILNLLALVAAGKVLYFSKCGSCCGCEGLMKPKSKPAKKKKKR